MNLMPHDTMTISVPASSAHVVGLLNHYVEPKSWFGFRSEGALFHGEVSEHRFTITPIIHYRNSFAPIVHGRITPHSHGTTVHVCIAMKPQTLATLLLLFAVMLALSVAACFTLNNEGGVVVVLFFIGMVSFLLVLSFVGFWYEVPRVKRLLYEILDL